MAEAAGIGVKHGGIGFVMPVENAVRMTALQQGNAGGKAVVPAFAGQEHIGIIFFESFHKLFHTVIQVVIGIVHPYRSYIKKGGVKPEFLH